MRKLCMSLFLAFTAVLFIGCTGDSLTEAPGHEAREVGVYSPPSMPSSDRTFEEAGMKRF